MLPTFRLFLVAVSAIPTVSVILFQNSISLFLPEYCLKFSANVSRLTRSCGLWKDYFPLPRTKLRKKNVQLLKNEQLCVADVMIIAADCTRADNESNSNFLFQLTNNHFSVNCPKPRNLL
jgi:hypothetical protein